MSDTTVSLFIILSVFQKIDEKKEIINAEYKNRPQLVEAHELSRRGAKNVTEIDGVISDVRTEGRNNRYEYKITKRSR